MFAQSPVRQDVSDLGVFGLDKQTAATDDVSSGNAADDIVAGVCVCYFVLLTRYWGI